MPISRYHADGRQTGEYNAWMNMKRRCTDPTHYQFKNYGERGIIICSNWLHSFETFLTDMGNRPSANYSLERRNNNKNYNKENCYWATAKEQA